MEWNPTRPGSLMAEIETKAMLPSQARVHALVRYPVKGLAGVAAEHPVTLRPGRGLSWDRTLAVENGNNVAESDGWNPHTTYFHLARYDSIARIEVQLLDEESATPTLVLRSAEGAAATVTLGEEQLAAGAADALFRQMLPAGRLRSPKLIRTTAPGLWDWPEATLSVINLATVREVERIAGVSIDARRFRANIYIDGLEPWSEFELLGQRVSIGDAVVEFFQPTDRCRATTINPQLGISDLNVPALLTTRFGHMYCGMYARVVSEGAVAAGSPVRMTPDSPAMTPVEVAPSWPRSMRLERREAESNDVVSFWLRDPLAKLSEARPGQNLRLHLQPGQDWTWRSYTISALDQTGAARISVKRDGVVSSLLHDVIQHGHSILASGPYGDVVLEDDADDVLLVSAGIGITPTVAMLRAMAGTHHRVSVVHISRTHEDAALWPEVVASCGQISHAQARLFLSRADPTAAAAVGAAAGRPDTTEFSEALADLDVAHVRVYVCGPGSFAVDVTRALAPLGIPAERIQSETFYSPTTVELAAFRDPQSADPHLVTVGADSLTWTRSAGTLLNAAEGAGLNLSSGCRVGVCGDCALTLVRGEVEYLLDPQAVPRAGKILTCCTAPLTDVELATTPP